MMKFKQKKGFLARDWVVAIVLFAGVISLFSISVLSIANNYGRSDIVNSDFNAKYNKLIDLTNDKNKMFNSVRSGQGLSLQGTFDIAFGSTFTVIQLVFGSVIMYETVAASFVTDYGSNSIFDAGVLVILFNLGITIITVILVFVWLSSISRGRL
jgi:hypothetical protein